MKKQDLTKKKLQTLIIFNNEPIKNNCFSWNKEKRVLIIKNFSKTYKGENFKNNKHVLNVYLKDYNNLDIYCEYWAHIECGYNCRVFTGYCSSVIAGNRCEIYAGSDTSIICGYECRLYINKNTDLTFGKNTIIFANQGILSIRINFFNPNGSYLIIDDTIWKSDIPVNKRTYPDIKDFQKEYEL